MFLKDYILLRRGYGNKKIQEERILRRAACIIISPWLKSGTSYYSLWPIAGDEELRRKIKEHTDRVALETLRMHRQGGFEYVLEGGRIIKRTTLN